MSHKKYTDRACSVGSSYCVLLADDDPDIRTIVRQFLERDGIQVVEARDGREALELIAERDFDLLIVDLLMPILDGYGVLQEIRRRAEAHAPSGEGAIPMPIIVLSSMSQQVHRDRVLQMGAKEFVVKPVDPDELYAIVGRHLSQLAAKGASDQGHVDI